MRATAERIAAKSTSNGAPVKSGNTICDDERDFLLGR
jgi:hypothetical protein